RSLERAARVIPPELLFPFPREERLLLVVAVLARRHRVAARRAASADQRHEVIHRERPRADGAPAVVAHAGGEPALPPPARAELPGARPLPLEHLIGHVRREALRRRHESALTVDSWSERSSHSFMSQATRSSVSFRDCAISRARWPSR